MFFLLLLHFLPFFLLPYLLVQCKKKKKKDDDILIKKEEKKPQIEEKRKEKPVDKPKYTDPAAIRLEQIRDESYSIIRYMEDRYADIDIKNTNKIKKRYHELMRSRYNEAHTIYVEHKCTNPEKNPSKTETCQVCQAYTEWADYELRNRSLYPDDVVNKLREDFHKYGLKLPDKLERLDKKRREIERNELKRDLDKTQESEKEEEKQPDQKEESKEKAEKKEDKPRPADSAATKAEEKPKSGMKAEETKKSTMGDEKDAKKTANPVQEGQKTASKEGK